MKAGNTYGELTAIKKIGSDKHGIKWLFKCSCGNEVIAYSSNVSRMNTRSCGDRQMHPTSAQVPVYWNNGKWKRTDIHKIECVKCGYVKHLKKHVTRTYDRHCPCCDKKEKPIRIKHCGICGVEVDKGKQLCDECRKQNKKKSNILSHKEQTRYQHAKENGQIHWNINLKELIERDNGVCALCGQQVNEDDYHITDDGYFVAHGLYPSIDHIIPLSKGGTHTWDNIQLAHCKCNSIKGASV